MWEAYDKEFKMTDVEMNSCILCPAPYVFDGWICTGCTT